MAMGRRRSRPSAADREQQLNVWEVRAYRISAVKTVGFLKLPLSADGDGAWLGDAWVPHIMFKSDGALDHAEEQRLKTDTFSGTGADLKHFLVTRSGDCPLALIWPSPFSNVDLTCQNSFKA